MDEIFDQPNINGMKIYENIRKIATGQREDYITACLLDYLYLKENYKLITIDLTKKQTVDPNPKARNLDQAEDKTMLSVLEEVKKDF